MAKVEFHDLISVGIDIGKNTFNIVGFDLDGQPEDGGGKTARDRLKGILDREASDKPQATSHKLEGHSDREQGVEPGPKPSIRERLDDVLNKPREKLDIETEPKRDREVESEREIDREVDRDRGLSH